jgi:hypothetical protein
MTRWFISAVAVMLVVTVVPARADEKSHRKAAEELLESMDMDRLLKSSIDSSLEMQVKANPPLAKFKDVVKKFLTKHMGYAALKEDLIKLYAKEFSEDELKDLTKFNKTPTGKKFLKKAPLLMQKAGELGMKKFQDNKEELMKMIQDALKEKE